MKTRYGAIRAVLVFSLGMILLSAFPAIALGQGMLVVVHPDQQVRLPRPHVIWPPPHPPRPVPPPARYQISELDISARVIDQVAQVQLTQTFVNRGSRTLEVSFVFPLPYDSAIDSMTLLVNGKEFPAKLLRAEEARRFYEEIVRKNRDPALLEWVGAGLVRTSVFPVPPGEKRTVTLHYTQLLRKWEGVTDFEMPLAAAKYTSDPIERFSLRVSVESKDEIKNVYSPTHAVVIKRPDDHHAVVTFTAKNIIPTSNFRLLYDVGRGSVGLRLLSHWPEGEQYGYFLLLATPKIKSAEKPLPKTVVFVIDCSGSMSGKKIEQARDALKFVLDNLREGDLFNIIAYSSDVRPFRPELEVYNAGTRRAAQSYVDSLYAGGSTNIDAALQTALSQLTDESRPSYVVFLTDGLPTAGVTDEMQIVSRATRANKVRARILAFGVGYDVNSRLLDRLTAANYGRSEYVTPEESIEERIARLYRRIEAPVLTDVEIRFNYDDFESEYGQLINRLYPRPPFDLFAGDQLAVVGRYRKAGQVEIVLEGKVGKKSQKFTFAGKLANKSSDSTFSFIEKLWAVRRIGYILDELDLKGENKELVEELVALATKHGILTPYTSFLADEGVDFRDRLANLDRANRNLLQLRETTGRWAFQQRAAKQIMQNAQQVHAAVALPSLPAGRIADALRGQTLGPMEVAEAQEGYAGKSPAVQQIADRTFYYRNGRWVDSTVSEEEEKMAQRVKQFSDDYFRLVRQFGTRISRYLVVDEPLIVKVDHQVFLIEP